jgi:dTDP-4-dehydrorhamnose 3,5-epimerase-like enzyme
MLETVTMPEAAFGDERGDIINVLAEPINHVAVITSKAGSVRGNHYHPEDVQYCYLVSGRYESYARDMNEPEGVIEKQVVEAGSLVLSPPMVAHAQVFLEDSVFLALTLDARESRRFDEHTIRVKVV